MEQYIITVTKIIHLKKGTTWEDEDIDEEQLRKEESAAREKIRKLEKNINLHGGVIQRNAFGEKKDEHACDFSHLPQRRGSICGRQIDVGCIEFQVDESGYVTQTKSFGRGSLTKSKSIKITPKTPEEIEFLDKSLGENFIFSDLTQDERKLLIGSMQCELVEEGSTIIRQGDVGDYFYIVQEGTVAFIINDSIHVGTCSTGGSFGELALLYDVPRAATCRASNPCKVWKVDQNTFRGILAGNANDKETKMMALLRDIPLLSTLDDEKLHKFTIALTPVKFQKGEKIVTKGDEGEVFYIVEQGQVKVHDIGLGDSQAVDQVLNPGDWFGERALLTGELRAANVTALSEVVDLQAMGRATFEKTFGTLQDIIDHEMKRMFLKGLPIFSKMASNLLPKEMNHLVDRLEEVCFKKGTKLVEAGKICDKKLFIIRNGKVCTYDDNGEIFHLQTGDYFGDKTVKEEDDQPSTQTIICEDNTTCWVLSRDDIIDVLGNIERLGTSLPFVSSKRNKSIKMKDLQKHRVLGQGAFGLVWLVSYEDKKKEEKDDKKIPYALKMVNKRQLIDSKQTKGIIREKDLLSTLDHPFILGLASSFQDAAYLYLVMELVQGGELFNVIHSVHNAGQGIKNDDAAFYAACIADALGHFHERLICYRDLKPENVLIDGDGYCVVVDLGFAKIVPVKTFTMCGTPEYLAPEIITSKGHNKAVDYWALGVLIYEMLVGRSPFFAGGNDHITMFKNIVRGKYTIPSNSKKINDANSDIIQKFLKRNQTARLGNLSGGYADIRNHPWFSSIDWHKLLKKEIEAPWVPKVDDPFDSHHFEDFSELEKEQPKGTPLTKQEQEVFEGF